MPPDGAAGILIAALHATFWLLVAARTLVSRSDGRDPGTTLTTAPHARAAVALAGCSCGAFYVFFGAWWAGSSAAGPAFADASAWTTIVGGTLAAAGVGLVAWAYVVFSSFRLTARTTSDDELCTRGPFALVRNPIYTGLDGLFLGSALAIPQVALLLCALAIAATQELRVRIEERVLVDAFGDEYRRYRERTPRYLPGRR